MASKTLDGNLVKKAHKQHRWTQKQIEELAKCQDPVTGPHYFMNNYFYIQHPTKGKMQYKAFDYQEGLIDAYHNHRFSIAMMGRQLGKCVCINTMISVQSHITGEIYDLSIGEFYKMQADLKRKQSLQSGDTPPEQVD